MTNHANFQISLKAIVKSNNRLLALKTPSGYVDFPGGRIDDDEIDLDNATALGRELKEELGSSIEFTIQDVLFVSRRDYTTNGKKDYIVAIYYDVTIINPQNIEVSDEHVSFEWLTVSELLELKDSFMSDDEYRQFSNYFINK